MVANISSQGTAGQRPGMSNVSAGWTQGTTLGGKAHTRHFLWEAS